MLNNGIFNGFEKLKIMTEIEQKIKEALLIRGFKNETILNNRGLIGAVIDETILATVKNTVDLGSVSGCQCQQSQCSLINGTFVCHTCFKPVGKQGCH